MELNQQTQQVRQELERLREQRRFAKNDHFERCRNQQSYVDTISSLLQSRLGKGNDVRVYIKAMKKVYPKQHRPPDEILERQVHLLSLSHHLEVQTNLLPIIRKGNIDLVELFQDQRQELQQQLDRVRQDFTTKEAAIMDKGKVQRQEFLHRIRVQRLALNSVKSKLKLREAPESLLTPDETSSQMHITVQQISESLKSTVTTILTEKSQPDGLAEAADDLERGMQLLLEMDLPSPASEEDSSSSSSSNLLTSFSKLWQGSESKKVGLGNWELPQMGRTGVAPTVA